MWVLLILLILVGCANAMTKQEKRWIGLRKIFFNYALIRQKHSHKTNKPKMKYKNKKLWTRETVLKNCQFLKLCKQKV